MVLENTFYHADNRERNALTSGKSKSVVGLGAIVVDHQMIVTRVPRENQKEHADAYREQIGGPVPTALVALRRLGFGCRLISPWGADANGTAIEMDLSREGLDWSDSCRSAARQTAMAHVWTSSRNGSRTIVAGPVDWSGFKLTAEDRRALLQCDLLHLDGQGGPLAVEAAQTVAKAGGLVMVDAGAPKVATAELIALADVFSFPERFAEQFFDDADPEKAGAEILRRGANAALCTRGEHGVTVFESHGTCQIPAFTVDTVDSTGAGDVFCGGVIAGLLSGKPLPAAVRTGAAAAALKCRGIGNRDCLPSPATLTAFLGSPEGS